MDHSRADDYDAEFVDLSVLVICFPFLKNASSFFFFFASDEISKRKMIFNV